MTISARFRRGSRVIDIDDLAGSGYAVIDAFNVSGPNLATTIAAGTALNAIGGVLVNQTARNRTYEFPITISGDSAAERQAHASRLQQFIRSGQIYDPVYLEVRLHDNYSFAPKWGQQGGYLRYEVITGGVLATSSWGRIAQADHPEFNIQLVVKPYATGSKQRLGTGTGALLEDTFGTQDGRSRGLLVPRGASLTNQFTNPIFGHSTWNNGWTIGGNIDDQENTDSEFLLFGRSSARLTRYGGTGTTFTQSLTLTVASYVASFFAKKRDGSAIDDTDIEVIYNSIDQTTNYLHVGNGWYFCWATFTGIASALGTGCDVRSIQEIFVDGFACHTGTYPTWPFHGDMMDVAWSGTAHASTSVRQAGGVSYPWDEHLETGQGTVRAVLFPWINSTALTADFMLFADDSDAFRGYYDNGNNRWTFNDGTNSINGTSDTFTAGTALVLHFVYEPGSLKIYQDGAEIATGSTFTPLSAPPTDLHIGSTSTQTQQSFLTISGFTTFDRPMTATQVSDDNGNISDLVNASDPALIQRVDWLPWIWTKDGDDTVDNANPPNDNPSDLDNFCVIQGVPGTEPAETRIEAELGAGNLGSDSRGGVILSLIDYDRFVDPVNLIGDDNSTASSSNDSGSGFARTSLSTSASKTATLTFVDEVQRMLAGRRVALLGRVQDAGANAQIRLDFGPADFGVSNWKGINTEANFLLRLTNGLVFPDLRRIIDDFQPTTAGVAFTARRTTGGPNNFDVDFFTVVASPILRIFGADGNVEEGFIYESEGHRVFAYDSGTTNIPSFKIHKIGDRIRLYPDKVNHLLVGIGDIQGTAMIEAEIADTLVFQKIHVTPRYLLM